MKPPLAVDSSIAPSAICHPGANPVTPSAAFFAGGAASSASCSMNSSPYPIQNSPDAMKHSRQSPTVRSSPMISGAAATPILPNTPLMPSRKPMARLLLISMAMPTG